MVVKRCETIVAPRGEGLWRYLKITGCSSYLRIKKSRKNTTGITNEKERQGHIGVSAETVGGS